MKIGMNEHTDITSGVLEETKVEFEANAVAFYAQVTGLASDKIGYPMRELSSNAWDESKGDFEIHLPTSLNPIFRVRDYGPGMSDQIMKSVYAKLYASTKRQDNGKVGGWGLGSKSPFAYLITDHGSGSYNVTSYHQGVMRSYVMSLSSEGELMMRRMVEMPSDERSGLDVSFSVRREDIYAFREKAKSILWSFNPRPKIFPASGVDWKVPEVQQAGENWTSYKGNSVPFYGPQVRMGCVMYPFDLDQIKTSGFLIDSDHVLFEAPIGSLKVTLSREKLAYDERTKTTLTELVQAYESAFISDLQRKVSAASNLFEANAAFELGVQGLGQSREERLRTVIDWRGLPMSGIIARNEFKLCQLATGWQHFDKFEGTNVRSTWPVGAKIVIEHSPCYSLGRFAMANLIGEKILWVRCKRIDRERTLRMLGNPTDVIDLDTFKVPVEKRIGKRVRSRRTLVVSESGLSSVTQPVDLADGGYYVEETSGRSGWGRRRRGSDFYRVSNGHHSMQLHQLRDIVSVCVEFGFLEQDTVIVVKKDDQELGEGWTLLGNDMIDLLRTKVDLAVFTGLHHKTLAHVNSAYKTMAKLQIWDNAPEDVKAWRVQLDALLLVLTGNQVEETVSDRAVAALSKLGISVNKPVVECPIEAVNDQFSRLCNSYPLLRMLTNGLGTYENNSSPATRNLKHYFSLLIRPSHPDEPINVTPAHDNDDDAELLAQLEDENDGDIEDENYDDDGDDDDVEHILRDIELEEAA